MTKKSAWGLGASVAALVMFSMGASAQLAPAQKAPTAPATVPAPTTKAPAATTKAPATTTVAPKAAPKAAAAPSCKGLDEAGCGAKTGECAWIVPKKVDAKTGKADKAYCRKVAGVAKKAMDAKAAAPAAAKTAPAAVTPTAPATPAPAAPKKN